LFIPLDLARRGWPIAGLPEVGGIVAVLRSLSRFRTSSGGSDRHVRALALALKLGIGDRPVIDQARDRRSSHDLGGCGRRRHPVVLAALSLPALFVAPAAARWSATSQSSSCAASLACALAAVAIRLPLHA